MSSTCVPWLLALALAALLYASQVTPQVRASMASPFSEPIHSEELYDHEVMWQAPSGKPRGVLFVAHGCSHAGSDFFPTSQECPHCLGLPEERRIVRAALSRGYAVVAVTSADRKRGCWRMRGAQSDLRLVAALLTALRRREGWAALPLYALGASSGGAFVLALPSEVEVAGVAAQIMALPPDYLADALQRTQARGLRYPPTLFQHMERDGGTAALVRRNMAMLEQQGVAVREVAVPPQPLPPSYFSGRIEGFPAALSEQLVSALRDAGMVNEGGYMTHDPRQIGKLWRPAVAAMLDGRDTLKPDQSAVAEVLNVAWAQHEIMSDGLDDALDWFEELQGARSS